MASKLRFQVQKVVGVTGIEPATSGPPALRSTTELHPVNKMNYSIP